MLPHARVRPRLVAEFRGLEPETGDCHSVGMIPIDDELEALASPGEVSALALVRCLMRFDEAAPPLRALLERVADGHAPTEVEALLFFRGIHVLGAGRDPQSCPAMLRLLQRPQDEIDDLLGDAVTQTLPRIVAGVFDGDADALLELAGNRRLDGFVRMALLGAAAFLTWDGRIESGRTIRFLEQFDDECLAEPGDPAWITWQEAIGLLGLDSLLPRVVRAWQAQRIDPTVTDPDECAELLANAAKAYGDIGRFHDANLGYIDDALEALAWTEMSDPIDREAHSQEPLFSVARPYINPWRHVGRNDPCPCGSGKKAKRCCLRT
jgi:hypothetical protein